MSGRGVDTITITGIRGIGHHGVFDFERENGQPFSVDVVIELHTARASATDDLANTVNYGEVAMLIHSRIVGEPVSLLETLAEAMAADCLAFQAVQRVTIRVHKPQAPIPVPFDDVVVSVTRHR